MDTPPPHSESGTTHPWKKLPQQDLLRVGRQAFGDLNISFLIDEDLKNYLELQRWIRGLGYPEKLDQFENWKQQDVLYDHFSKQGDEPYSDGTLQVLNSNNITNIEIRFRRLFPYSLSTLNFNASDTDVNYFTAQASFKYTIYDIHDIEGNNLL